MTSSSFPCAFGLVLFAAVAPASAQVAIGDTPSYSFRQEVLNAPGVETLEDLRGRPVLIEIWGRQHDACVGGSVPAALELQRTFGEDLVVLFVESQGASLEDIEVFSMKRKWLGTGAIWTNESPFYTGSDTLPDCALLGLGGEVLMKGNSLSIRTGIKDAIREQIELANSPPDGAPKSLKAAWKSFGKGDYAKAIAAAEKVAAKGKADAEDAAAVAQEFRDRVGAKIDRGVWELENGYAADGRERIHDLLDACKGEDQLVARLEELVERLEGDELEAELEASEALKRIEKRLYTGGPSRKHQKALEKLAETYADTKVAERARKLAEIVGRAD